MGINYFKIVMSLKGYPLKKAQAELSKIKSLNSDEFEEYIKNRKWEQFNYHLNNNHLYKQILGEKNIVCWNDIPIITKRDLQKPIDELISKGHNLSNVFKNSTSGSSGTPFYFAKDKMAHAKTWVLNLDRYKRHNIIYGISLQARFYGIPLSGIKYYKEKIKDFIACRERFPVFDLSDDKLNLFIDKFRRKKFEYINGYASSLVFFASYLIRKGIVLKEICPTLKICFPTSEMCSLLDRALLEKGFGIKVANEYGCAEMDILAFEDEDFDWIISNENVYLEIVDENGNVVEPGKSGRIIITSLYNKAMPLIRYEVGDMGLIEKRKKKNHTILKDLIGRTNEFAILPSGRRVPALTFYYITKTLIQEDYKIKEFIIKQISIINFHFEYVSDVELPIDAKSKINRAMDEYLEPGLISTFERKEYIERTKAGKLRQFYNLIVG